jgi:hypothetical protein
MLKKLVVLCLLAVLAGNLYSHEKIDDLIPVRGFCISAPKPGDLNDFIRFIKEELAPRKVNNLILRVDFNYRYESHPELRDSDALSKEDVRKLVMVCQQLKIRIIPQINLLGHQSWASRTGNLLRVYPEFDETPNVKMPAKYTWPNPDKLYCKSYCPLHPKVHELVFAIVDEICDVFDADAFHAGMDEVFYIGEDQCPRCSGKDKAALFAGEVKAIHDHLSMKGRQLWIWGDRLLDGKTSGLGEWEASYSNTFRAIDLIPKDIMICDWHYERPVQTAAWFAINGFNVVTCPWRNGQSAVNQVKDMVRFRNSATPAIAPRFSGIVQTIWSGTRQFMDNYYGIRPENQANSPVSCFKAVYEEILRLSE